MRDRLKTLTQTKSVYAYLYAFKSLALKISDTSQAELLHAFIWGLKDRLEAELYLRNPRYTPRQLVWLLTLMSACILCITKLCPAGIQDISLNEQGLQIPEQTVLMEVSAMERRSPAKGKGK